MSDDIVTRLRDKASQVRCVVGVNTSLVIPMLELEAADEIEKLRQAIYDISDLARKHYIVLWSSINDAVSVADEHHKNCDCGERY
jgi:hypothetical protein